MKNQFGPWATLIDAGSNPQLSAFWRRRLTMLVPVSQTSPILSRRNLIWLGIVGILMIGVPTLRSISAVASEKTLAAENDKVSATDMKTPNEAVDKKSLPSDNDETKNYCDYDTWRINLKLKVQDPKLTAVQYALFDKDPIPGFTDRVKNMRESNRNRYIQADQVERKNWKAVVRSTLMSGYWDRGFADITGNHLDLLTSRPDATHGLLSKDPGGKKWVVTKCESINGKPICWCIPVELKFGKWVHVTLTEDNQFDLGAAFDEATQKWAETK
jgi:hypothetical protein